MTDIEVKILDFLKSNSNGATRDEIGFYLWSKPSLGNSANPHIGRLRAKGLIKADFKSKPTKYFIL